MVALLLALLFHAQAAQAGPVLLHGFKLVDPSTRTVREQDLVLSWGKVGKASDAGPACKVIEGRDRYLLPLLWDMKASLWGNDSAKDFKVLEQELGITQGLRVQLYYGVGHVVATYMSRDWVSREMKRAGALQFPAAELLYPDKVLAAPGGFDWACLSVSSPAQVGPLVDDLKAKGVCYLQVSALNPASKTLPGLSDALLKAVVGAAEQRGLKCYVFVDAWDRARTAVAAGAAAIQGLPEGQPSASLLRLMRSKHCAYAPSLALFLETNRLLGHPEVLQDPFMRTAVQAEVADSFLDPAGLWEGWRWASDYGKKHQVEALRAVKAVADAGVEILSVTDAGWSAGLFHGYATHSVQGWLEKAGLEPWVRLSAATVWPAELMGRHIGFSEGDPGDFLALDADPLQSAASLRQISFVIRDGAIVERASLQPDLSRQRFKP